MTGKSVAVIGAGIAGLAAARRLRALHPDATITVYEASGRVGGKLHRAEVGGHWIDVGAESMLARRPEAIGLAADLGLTTIAPQTTSALLRNRGRNRPLPARTVMGIPSDLGTLAEAEVLSDESVQRIATEPDFPAVESDISVGDLVAQRFGDEVVDRLVEPLLGGVYAGRARAISLRASVPGLYQRLHSQGGSLRATAQASVAAGAGATGPVFASLPGGLAGLPLAVAAEGGFELALNTTVRRITRTDKGFRLKIGAVPERREVLVDAVVVATPAGKASTLLADLVPVAAAELAGIETASMAIVTLAFDDRPELPPGSGVLIPEIEGFACKATTFSSQKWPGVGDGVFLLRASLGRAGDEVTLQREDAELIEIVRRELAEIVGLADQPIDTQVQRWGGGLPQYAVGHVDRVTRIGAAVAAVPGLAVCGASYDGVGVPACIGSAHIAADRVSAVLAPAAQ